MDSKSAARLRLIGFLVVGIALALLWLPMMADERVTYNDAIASTLAIGIGLLLIAEVGPVIKSLKAGGVEIEFLDTVTGKFNTLEGRVTALELAAKHPGRSAAEVKKLHEARPPAVDKPITIANDPQKGRWGGLAERDGFTLSADFQNVGKSSVEVILNVRAAEQTSLQSADCVEFHLHDTFNPDVVPAVFEDGKARLSLIAYGGFTVGVWIGCTNTELELDLSKVKGAPRIIRDL
jgi:ethanolamine utilization microcompartment shell protein EutS